MKVICAWRKKVLGSKPGPGITHGICEKCEKEFLKEVKK